ncbi:hypothetical protein [Marinobacterium stanieri]|uniref:hypothetical protein n=1 Tax=Marinobacterium stanieri TaxID=49186 RepID=UPI0011125ABA|nr:hypothetical protein [Marinobacterium stanieri]
MTENSVIKNGRFSPELNAFVSVPGGQGSAKGLMVGMDRTTGEITIKPAAVYFGNGSDNMRLSAGFGRPKLSQG